MRLEDARQNRGCDARSIIDRLYRHSAFFVAHRNLHVTRAGEPRILEHVEEHVTHLVLLAHRPDRTVRAAHLPLDDAISHLLEAHDVLYDGGDVDVNCRRQISGAASIPTEPPRDHDVADPARDRRSAPAPPAHSAPVTDPWRRCTRKAPWQIRASLPTRRSAHPRCPDSIGPAAEADGR